MSVRAVGTNGKYTVISTFAGGGGSSLGYQWAGFKELLAIEWEDNAAQTLQANFDFPVWQKDITTVSGSDILKFSNIEVGELDILDGSPPCQGFSTAGKRKVRDERNDLYLSFIRLINELQPKVFVMENVSGLIKGKMKGKYNEIMNELKKTGYNVKCRLMNAKYYEVPQSRERLIWIGVRSDLEKEPVFPKAMNRLIVFNDAVKNIINNELPPPLSPCFREYVPKMKAGQSVADVMNENKHHQTVRIHGNKVCPTITKIIGGIGFGSLIHPREDRVLSVSELLAVCSFPTNYKLIGSYQEKRARLGNAVMPKMMYHIAKHIKENILNP